MKKYIATVALGLLVITGCDKKPKPIKPPPPPVKVTDKNETVVIKKEPIIYVEEEPVVEVIEEEEPPAPKLGIYDWRVNDELITKAPASKIVVIKSKRVMVLFDKDGNVLSRHRISLGKNNIGTKLKKGDYKTPEGRYKVIDMRRDKVYYKEILISYPNKEDKARSKSLGFNPGGGITIHAQPNWNWDGHGNDYTLENDWTEGCMAVTNKGMDTIWEMIRLGTPIEIRE
jgi:lipoprotein-anchoring transpeptidase ErfK/SrfK